MDDVSPTLRDRQAASTILYVQYQYVMQTVPIQASSMVLLVLTVPCVALRRWVMVEWGCCRLNGGRAGITSIGR